MITIYKKKDSIAQTNERSNEIEIRCLSTDTKPTINDNKDITNGTILIEIDTGRLFLYDLDNNQWKEV